eukprot:2393520-Pleurochrysis_carterae.AAC.1
MVITGPRAQWLWPPQYGIVMGDIRGRRCLVMYYFPTIVRYCRHHRSRNLAQTSTDEHER